MHTGQPIAAPVEAILALGYANVRWRAVSGGHFTALDEFGIPSIIVVDVAPLHDGYPMPRLSPARAERLSRLCQAYLQDHTRSRKAHADHLVLPHDCEARGPVPITHRSGVAWAFASRASTNYGKGSHECAGRFIYGMAST